MLLIGVFPQPIGNVARGNVDQYVAAASASSSQATATVIR